jgi:hypothetical protein
MPWKILREAAPDHRAPKGGERWRVNFSRVQWQMDVVDGRYVKRTKPGAAILFRGQLGLESAGRRQHAHARALGLRPVLERASDAERRHDRRRSEREAQVGVAPSLLSSTHLP